jgi:hypothetical protein
MQSSLGGVARSPRDAKGFVVRNCGVTQVQNPNPIAGENTPNFVLTAEQAELDLELRKLLGTAIADRYADFCRLASGALPLATSRPLASHALRELDSEIRRVLAVPLDAVASDDAAQQLLRSEACKTLRGMGFPEDAVQRSDKSLRPQMTHKAQIRRIVERLGLDPKGISRSSGFPSTTPMATCTSGLFTKA